MVSSRLRVWLDKGWWGRYVRAGVGGGQAAGKVGEAHRQAYVQAKLDEAHRAMEIIRYEKWFRSHGGLRLASAMVFDMEVELKWLRALFESWSNVQEFRQFARDLKVEMDTERKERANSTAAKRVIR